MQLRSYNLQGLDLQFNPLLRGEGHFVQLVNVDSAPFGAKKKRAGYATYLGTPDNFKVNTLWDWHKNNGTQFWNYRASGSSIYYSTQGTGAWTICGNGTITDGANVVNAVLNDQMIIGAIGTTRYTTNGTSFTDVSGIGDVVSLTSYQRRIWAGGTDTSVTFSTAGTASDWTSDSSSIIFGDSGRIFSTFKSADRLIVTKNTGQMFHTDSSYVTDMATELGPTSIQSITQKEGAQFWLNRFGYYLFEGATPTLVSNNIQPQIYNDAGSAIAGTIFDNAPSGQYKYGIYTAVGTVTDDFSNETVTNAIQKYDYQLNEWSNYAMGTNPTAFHTYKDAGGIERFIFGDGNGQCYTFGGTALADNGKPVQAIMEMVYAGSLPEADKRWSTIWLFFNPGCQAQVQVACDDTFHRNSKKWIDLGDASSGMIEFKFPANTRSKLIYIKISESSPNDRFVFYGFTCDYAIEEAYANN